MHRLLPFFFLVTVLYSCHKTVYHSAAEYCHHKEYLTRVGIESINNYYDSFTMQNVRVVITYPEKGKKYQVKIYTPEGWLKAQYTSNSKVHADSIYTEYYPDGKIELLATPFNDTDRYGCGLSGYRHGNYTWLDTLGRLVKKETYRKGALQGPYTEYYPTGQAQIKASYKDYKLEGPFEEYYPNGKLKMKGNYLRDKQDGKWQYFDTLGRLVKTKQFKPAFPLEEIYELMDVIDFAEGDAAIKRSRYADSVLAADIAALINTRSGYNVYNNYVEKVFVRVNGHGNFTGLFYTVKGENTLYEWTKGKAYVNALQAYPNSENSVSYLQVNYHIFVEEY